MKTSEQQKFGAIFSAIKEAGGRVTKVRTRIIEFLAGSKKPASIAEIVSKLSIDEVSVYRTIAYFKEMGFIEEIITPDGVRRFALQHGHHHHIMCTDCGHVEHIPCTQKVIAENITHPSFSVITNHQLTYYGTCAKCCV